MCDSADSMMQEMDEMKDDIESIQEKLDAIAKYLKMDFQLNPETYEMVKPSEVSNVPMQVR